MNITIRNENKQDYRKVEEVAREAFWNLYFPGCSEHMVIHNMRNHPDFIPELSFVIEVDGEIVGSIFYTHSKVVSSDGTQHKTITFGPVSILPSMHRKGLGRKLITHSIEEAKKLGYNAILTLGYPYHYETYGFVGGKKYKISMPDGKYYKGLLVLPLYEGALDNISGYAVFSDALETNEEEVEIFDKSFEPKEKGIQDSQKEYEIACCMLDED
ncbi:GNAT family N-acetyltransferase [Paraclostridium bifermentans]|uniref:GNAT family N-acetyltransferase n=1 Tax=Paraclostridium bifermentans TaxID=1490 RepID=UPI00359C90F7